MTKSTITRERLEKIKSWRETYGAGSNVMLPAEEAEELARIALAVIDSEPVVYDNIKAVELAVKSLEDTIKRANRFRYCLGALMNLYEEVALLKNRMGMVGEPVAISDDMAHAFHYALTDSQLDNNGVAAIKKGLRAAFANVVTPLYRHAQQPVVPPMQHWEELCREHPDMSIGDAIIRAAWWNHCRAAMLQAGYAVRDLSTPVDPQVAEYEQNVMQAGNSPVIPEGYVMVPKEPTEAMINAWLSEVANWRGHVAGYKAMLAAGPQEVK